VRKRKTSRNIPRRFSSISVFDALAMWK